MGALGAIEPARILALVGVGISILPARGAAALPPNFCANDPMTGRAVRVPPAGIDSAMSSSHILASGFKPAVCLVSLKCSSTSLKKTIVVAPDVEKATTFDGYAASPLRLT